MKDMTDGPGQPGVEKGPDTPAAVDAQQGEQALSLTTQQAAAQLHVHDRTIRRWISDGLRTPSGTSTYLEAHQVATGRNPEWRIYQHDLEAFQKQRDQTATEGQPAGQLVRQAEEQALTLSVQLFAAELERRAQALAEAQTTIERLAREAGQYAGRNEILERELETLRQRVSDLELERERWQLQQQQKSWKPPKRTPRRIKLLPWQ